MLSRGEKKKAAERRKSLSLISDLVSLLMFDSSKNKDFWGNPISFNQIGTLLSVIYRLWFNLFSQVFFWSFSPFLHLGHLRFDTRLLERWTKGSLQSREHCSAALPWHSPAVWWESLGSTCRPSPLQKLGSHKSLSFIHNKAWRELLSCLSRRDCLGGRFCAAAQIPDQTSTVAGGVKKKLKQAETNCL